MKITYTPDELALLALAKRTQTVEEYVHDTSVWAAWCRASDECAVWQVRNCDCARTDDAGCRLRVTPRSGGRVTP